MVKMIVVWALAAVFVLNSLIATLRMNFNMGTVLVWGCSAMLAAYGVFHRAIDMFCANGLGRVLKYAFWGGLAVFAGLFVFVAVSGYTRAAKGDEKAIIVLGAGLRGEAVGGMLRRRLAAALELWRQNQTAVIVVTGGQGPQEAIPEAVAMGRWLAERGVPESNIIVEARSESTEQNLLYAKRLLQEAGIGQGEPVAVVTNAFHCYRAAAYAQKLGFANVRTAPASVDIVSVLPSYMREVLAVLFMWVFRGGAA